MATYTITIENDYIIIHLDRGKANAINATMVTELRNLIKNIAGDDTKKGLILSGKENFFSAGLDIVELYDYNEKVFEEFWINFLGLFYDLCAFEKPMIAAITGHAPAGGCVMAMAADYRIMAEGNYRIGLNEIPVGIIVPRSIFEVYAFWIGKRKAYQNLMEGKLLSGHEAHEVGLVDELLPANKVLTQAKVKIQQYISFNPTVWSTTKRNLRSGFLPLIKPEKNEVFMESLAAWWSPTTRKMLADFIEGLKKK